MPSPFPGMDPYIEGQIWSDFHETVIPEIRAALIESLRPRYIALVEEYVYLVSGSEELPRSGALRTRPDALVIEALPAAHPQRAAGVVAVAERSPHGVGRSVMLPLPDMTVEPVRHAFIRIRERETRTVVTVIEVLSPFNKGAGGEGRQEYLNKRALTLQSDANLVELDLLRGGIRLPMGESLPPAAYYAFISRASERPLAEVVPIPLRERLPVIPIPLAGDDPDTWLDLQDVFTSVYDRAGYDYALDYRYPVAPPLDADDAAWAASVLDARGLRSES